MKSSISKAVVLGIITLALLIGVTYKTGNAVIYSKAAYSTSNTTLLLQSAFRIIAKIESNANCRAVNKRTKATGIVQITGVCIRDINRLYRTNFTKNDAKDLRLSYKMFVLYVTRYCKTLCIYEIARVWSSGSKGTLNPNYRKKVKQLSHHYDNNFARLISTKSFTPSLTTKLLYL